MENKTIGNNPHIIPSFKLFTNPACVTELSVLLRKVVSLNMFFKGGVWLELVSACTNDRVSFTHNQVSIKPKSEMAMPT